jgi:RNA polymerase sigma-70 factor (sigma-E family)
VVSAGQARTADEEFRAFMGGRWPVIVRLAYGLTGDLGNAENMARAAFARAYASWGKVTRDGDPDAYLRRLVVNEHRRWSRRHRGAEDRPCTPPEQGATDLADATDEREALLTALARLGPRQRAVIVLRFWMGMSEAETAQVMGCTASAVKSQASSALDSLRADYAALDIGLADGDFTGGDFASSDLTDGDFTSGDFTDGDLTSGDLTGRYFAEGEFTDDDVIEGGPE